MIRINLLPFRAARTKENVRRQISIFMLVVTFIVLVMFSVTLKLKSEKTKTALMLSNAQKELTKYKKQAKEVDRLRKEKELLQKKIDIIAQLEDIRKEPVILFTELTDVHVAERMWLSNFKTQGRSIKILGTALDEITIADYAKRLELSEKFSNVNLKYLKHGVTQKVKIKQFEVTASIGNTKKAKKQISGKAMK